MKKVGIIGCGNLGLSILKGIQKNNSELTVYASKRNLDSLDIENFGNAIITSDNELLIKNCDVLIVALKPYTILPFLTDHKDMIDSSRHTIVSAATGVTINQMSAVVDKGVGIYRVMPNTASSVNESITAMCSNSDLLERRPEIESLFQSIGDVVFIEENLMESATILGACGVAYVLRFMRAMIQGGIEVGFDATTATKIVSQTMKGASELIIKNGTHPEQEIDKVTTPKGCTIVGLNEMEHAGFSSALIKGIVTSYQKIEK